MSKRIVGLILSLVMIFSVLATLASCNIFGGDEPKEHQHTFSDKWSYDENNHWHAATCEHTAERDGEKKHNDTDYDGICNACGYNLYGEKDDNSARILTYIVDVTDASGNPVEGVNIILVSPDGFYTSTKTTSTRGRVSFELEEGNWVAALAEAVEGYSNSIDDRYELVNRKVTIVLQ